MNNASDSRRRPTADATPSRRESWLSGQKEAFSAAVSGARLEQPLDILISTAIEQFEGASRGAFYIFDENRAELSRLLGMPQSYLESVNDLTAASASIAWSPDIGAEATIVTPDVRKDPRWKQWLPLAEEYDYRGCWSFPIEAAGGRLIGKFAIYFPEPRNATPGEVELATSLCAAASIIIALHQSRSERMRAKNAFEASEDRLRIIVESARDYAIFTTDRNDLIETWLPGASNVFGWTKEEVEGQPADVLFTPEDRRRGEPRHEVERAIRDGKASDVRWHQHKDGHRVYIEGQVLPLYDGGRKVLGFLKIGQDTTPRKLREDAVHASEERFRQFGESSSDLLWIRNAQSLAFEYLSPAFERLYGLPAERMLSANTVEAWLELLHPDDREGALGALQELRGGIPLSHEFRVLRPDGQLRWIHNTDFPMLGEMGEVQSIAGIAQDVTERRRAMDVQRTLMAELQHRVRNILAVTRSIVRRTSAGKADVHDFVQHLEGRIDAMARTQALLTRSPGSRVDLEEIVRDELLAQAAREPKYSVSGPRIQLEPQAAEVLTLALHELATNSVKYGALTETRGKVRIKWQREHEDDQDWLKFNWTESDVDITNVAPNEGFGTELITRRVPYELGGRGEIRFERTGMTATIEFPLKEADSILQPRYATLSELAT